MSSTEVPARFSASLLRPAASTDDAAWAFVVLPKSVSALFSRRGRVSASVRLHGQAWVATLEPDGQLSHWLQISAELMDRAGVSIGDCVQIDVAPLAEEPEPSLPDDFAQALNDQPAAYAGWAVTTVLARVDWIHWICSAKQSRTRSERIAKACGMLATGKLRVCCFDSSGFYSKAFSAPKRAE